MAWTTLGVEESDGSATVHVLPLDDLAAHDTTTPRGCDCHPEIVEFQGKVRRGILATHKSFDGREITERAKFAAADHRN